MFHMLKCINKYIKLPKITNSCKSLNFSFTWKCSIKFGNVPLFKTHNVENKTINRGKIFVHVNFEIWQTFLSTFKNIFENKLNILLDLK